MKTRLLETLGMLLIGDGILTLADPKRHCLLWEIGPESCRKMTDEFALHPTVSRIAGLMEAGLGLLLAEHQKPTLAKRLLY